MSRPGTQAPRRRPTNKPCRNLDDEENHILMELLGPNAYSLATGIAQVLRSNPRRQWERMYVGVLCFVKDYTDKAYFLRLYDLNRREQLWDQMLYNDFRVNSYGNVNRLLTFEGDKFVYGLNFALVDEAQQFKQSLDRCYEQQQKHKRRGSASMADGYDESSPAQTSSSSGYGSNVGINQPRNPPNPNKQAQISSNNIVIPTSNPVAGDLFSTSSTHKKSDAIRTNKKGKKKGLTKADIGLPTNFEHRVHVGWDASKGLQSKANVLDEELDPNIKHLLQLVGVSDAGKLRKEDKKFIYEFVDQHGGMDQLKKELGQQHHSSQPPPVPPPPPSRQPAVQRQTAPPPPPRDPPASARPLPPTPRSAPSPVSAPIPPAPPTMQSVAAYHRPNDAPPPPPPPISSLPRPGAGPVPVPPAPPPPPPPPMPPMFNTPSSVPVPPPVPQSLPASGGRSDLLKEIQEGRSLRHVEPALESPQPAPGGRDKLMDSIRMGVTLRETPKEQRQERVSPPDQMGGIAGALARALAERRMQIESDESESESDEDEPDQDDDEWGD